jgi:hypothetical protein
MKRITAVIVLIFVFALGANAQDFKKVVDIVVEMEASLKNMITKEESQRKTEVSALKSQVDELRTTFAHVNTTRPEEAKITNVELLAERIDAMEKKVGENSHSTEVATLTTQLSGLLVELRKSIDDSKVAQAAVMKPAPPVAPSMQVSGQAFAYYTYTTSGIEGKDFNRFDLDRLYLTAKGQVFEDGKFQLTTDLYRNTATGSYYSGFALRVKFAFFDYTPASELSIKFGVIPTVWPGFVDGVWKYRGISATITDRQGYYSTADIGMSVSYALPERMGDVTGFILNGNGFTSPETNRFKDFALKASITPFVDNSLLKTLLFAGYAYKGSNLSAVSNALKRDRVGGLVSYNYSVATVSAEYNIRKDAPSNPDTVSTGNALSLFGEIKVPIEEWKNKLTLFWRYDIAEPNVDKGGDMTRFGILGVAYKPTDKITVAIDHQWVRAESETLKRNDGTKTEYDGRWFLHSIINF